MRTLKLKIINTSNSQFIIDKQLDYSCALRKLYKNIDCLSDELVSYVKYQFNLNTIEYRSVLEEAKTKFAQTMSKKKKISEEILALEDGLIYLKTLDKSNKLIRKIFKLTRRLELKNKSLSKDITFGGAKNLIRLSHLCNSGSDNEIANAKNVYQEGRILPLYVLGEANQMGNRFFKFDFNNNKLTYKSNLKNKVDIHLCQYNNHRSELARLQELSDLKLISVSVRLSKDYVYLIFDDECLSGFSLNKIDRSKDVLDIKNRFLDKETEKQLIKELYVKYYDEQICRKMKGKLSNRYLAIDTNPDYIGCSIIDKTKSGIKVIHAFNYDLTELNKKENHKLGNKRKHGIYHIWKDLFKTFSYYKCGNIVVEDLNIKGDLGNKAANRKVKNLWYRELSENLLNKYCNKLGVNRIDINPCYTSFIGNLYYNFVDPVNASIEIGRRGAHKFEKNMFYPAMDAGTIMNTMDLLNEQLDVSLVKDCNSWVELHRKVQTSGLRYRATMNDCQKEFVVVNNLFHSKIVKVNFSC